MPSLQRVDESFFDSAPHIYTRTFAIERPAAEVWGELTSDSPLHWVTGLSVRWKTARPFGVGTVRQAKIAGGLLTVQEEYFLWDEGRRHAFFVTRANAPMFAALAEDYVVEPTGNGSCAFTWTIAVQPSTIGKLGAPVNGLVFKRLFAETAAYFDAG